jgi:hypothetical protein
MHVMSDTEDRKFDALQDLLTEISAGFADLVEAAGRRQEPAAAPIINVTPTPFEVNVAPSAVKLMESKPAAKKRIRCDIERDANDRISGFIFTEL